jgi:hypothetical protein
MQTIGDEILQAEPDTWICTTERITSELSRCSKNNKECKNGLSAGKTSTYCLHPDHKKFLMISN